MPSVYVETSVISYLAARPSSDINVASSQLITSDWWNNHRSRFRLLISQVVIDECSAGDPIAAQERLSLLTNLPVIGTTQKTFTLATALMQFVGLPQKAFADALHIAVAAHSGADYLVTWNCKHIANPAFQRKIEDILRQHNLEPPVICTPLELINV